MQDMLQQQKTKVDERDYDIYTMLTKQPELLDHLQAAKQASSDSERQYRSHQGKLAMHYKSLKH